MYRFASIARLATVASARTARVNASVSLANVSRIMTVSSKLNSQQPASLFVRSYSGGGALTRQDIESRILNLLRDFDKVNQDKLTEVADFNKDLGLDSLDTVEVVMAIEEEFSVEITDDEADKITTVKEAIDFISKRDDAH
ncbi:mitochondrial acyl carrier protein [Coemansia sp. RSA 1813]|nr:mitochondrial acyl carrier protein [Coemansia sp. RSA 1646]KAJ1770701.1 mitochondrial acyl carrier protein [Coemansia sp. RSA 1843]KAJ2087351.1 mitochondrial acyl carrier protein [Coemansia sp. RSA 986]KAJ2215685.1 mitochondrial acyl carrier protein [Coemansia sp. RSA 487]KAJ2568430.1 mitochondrial acyl carrier protein [Coemansia sp. RSA 1813]